MAHIERLRNLERVVKDTPPELFDMGSYRCGTVACAFGHAAMDPWHIEQGLSFCPTLDAPAFETESGIWAASSFYEIPSSRACDLFLQHYYDGSYPVQEQCLQKIRDLISKEERRG